MKWEQVSGRELHAYRVLLQMNQSDFWGRVGVTQSGGSRYENGRPISKQTAFCLAIAYGTDVEAERTVAKLRKIPVGKVSVAAEA